MAFDGGLTARDGTSDFEVSKSEGLTWSVVVENVAI